MFEKFIEYKGALYGFNKMKVTERDGEFLVIYLNDDTKIELTGSPITLPLKYNVLKEFLDKGLVYNKQHNVLSFDDLNKPDTYNTDGVYRGEIIVKVKVVKSSKIEILLSNGNKRLIDMRKLPFWYLIKDFNTEKYLTYTPYQIIWSVSKNDNKFNLRLNIRDIVTFPILSNEQIAAEELEEAMNKTSIKANTSDWEVELSKEEIERRHNPTDEDIMMAAELEKFTENAPKKKTKPRTVSKEKLNEDLNN